MDNFKKNKYLRIGGFVALAIDKIEENLLVVTHSGRGVINLTSGRTTDRDNEIMYPENNKIQGIGVFGKNLTEVHEYDFKNNLVIFSQTRQFKFICDSSGIQVYERI